MTVGNEAPHLTRWDEVMAMRGLSLIAGIFVDPAAVQTHLALYVNDAQPADTAAGG